MRYLYAVETAAQLSAYEAIANRLRPRLEAYLRFLREEYAVESPPRAIVWTGREIARSEQHTSELQSLSEL